MPKELFYYCLPSAPTVATESVRQLPKTSLKQYRSPLAERSGPGGI
jgi:hypothetical protein